MALVPQQFLRRPSERASETLHVTVIFTSVAATLAALKQAGSLARGLDARITLVVPQVVPYPLPLEEPSPPVEFNERRFHLIAGGISIPTSVRIYLCRDRIETLRGVLDRSSIILVAGPKRRWWPAREQRLAKTLRRAGFDVIFRPITA